MEKRAFRSPGKSPLPLPNGCPARRIGVVRWNWVISEGIMGKAGARIGGLMDGLFTMVFYMKQFI